MLLLDDGTHYIYSYIAATKFAKAFRPMWLNWLHHQNSQVRPHTPVFLDSVLKRMMVRQFRQQQFVR